MYVDLQGLINELGQDFALNIARNLRPMSNYHFNSILPERNRTSYHVDFGDLIIRPTMAGLVGMDSSYPEIGSMTVAQFMENTAKLAGQVTFPEKMLRDFYELAMRAQLGVADHAQLLETLMSFVEKVIVQPHMDAMEWLRGQALTSGAISWTFNGHNLAVTYGVPAANLPATRTTASTEAYGAAGSKWWDDYRTAQSLLRYNVANVTMNTRTFNEIVYNEANRIRVLEQDGNMWTLTRHVGTTEVNITDARDRVTVTVYDLEGEVLDTAAPETPKKVQFMPDGKITFTARNQRSEFYVGEGATEDPVNDREIGYTHIAPTTEGGNAPGRWARVYVPPQAPHSFAGQGVTNGLPVITAPDKLVVLSTELA